VYTKKNPQYCGNTWLMNNASMVALPACSDGNAPKTMGDAVNFEV